MINGPWTRLHAPTLRRVLRLLVSQGVFVQVDQDRIAANESSEWLRSDVPRSLKPIAECYGAEWNWTAWMNLLEAVRTGRTAFDITQGVPLFGYLGSHPPAAVVFDRYMSVIPSWSPQAVASGYDFSAKKLVVDVGGGVGALPPPFSKRTVVREACSWIVRP